MAEEDAGRQLANAKKRRGVARTSLTRLSNAREPKTLELALRMSQKLADLDSEFRTHHHALIDLMDDKSLAKEQDVYTGFTR
jgi:hypothetical protein